MNDTGQSFKGENMSSSQGQSEIKMPVDKLSFRQASNELDQIVSMLESNTLELEDSLKQYERGVALVANLQKRLDEAQQKVDVLMGQLDLNQDDEKTDTTLS